MCCVDTPLIGEANSYGQAENERHSTVSFLSAFDASMVNSLLGPEPHSIAHEIFQQRTDSADRKSVNRVD